MDADPTTSSSSTSSSPRARSPAPFVSKTYDLIERSGAHHIISWNDQGTGFVVWSPDLLSRVLLPRYFKHNNFSSFIRQLNTYGFKKSASDRWEFRHEKFRMGERHLIAEITRRRCGPSVFPSFLNAREEKGAAASASAEVEQHLNLMEENKSLQRQNSEMRRQIAQLKALETELRRLSLCMAAHTHTHTHTSRS
ncbi:hypothetical protein ACLOJK_024544 [Asimina triloba]